MEEEFFYGLTLDKKDASVTWNVNDTGEGYQAPLQKLIIKQFLLGHTAKENEYNVVEIETMSTAEHLKIPVAVLKVGETRSIMTHFEFPDAPVTFKLIEGNGPVYIVGNQVPVFVEQIEDEVGEEAEMVEEEHEDEDSKHASKKRKVAENGSKAATNGNGTNAKNNKKPAK